MKRTLRTKARALPGEHDWGTSGTGTQQVGIRVEVIQGDPHDEIKTGSQWTWYGYFTEKSGERTLESLEIAGWNSNPGDDFINLVGLGSTEFELTFEEEEDVDEQGNPAGSYWKPGFINRAGVAMRNKMDDGAKRAFAADMHGLILARKQSKGGAAPAQQQRQAPQSNQRPATAAFGTGQQRQQQRAPQGQQSQYQDSPPPADKDIPF
jgi:hypothetical protein